MSEPFLGQIKIVGFNFAPRGWALCDGQILPINSYQALYSLLGTTYGGDGRTSFALPDLRGRAPVHVGSDVGTHSFSQGQRGGEERHTLTTQEMPQHTHTPDFKSGSDGISGSPAGRYLSQTDEPEKMYAQSHQTQMAAGALTVQAAGSGQAHENMQPYLVMNYVIALQGLFPPRN